MELHNISMRCILAATLAAAGTWVERADAQITLDPVGSYASGGFDTGAAETVAFDPVTRRIFASNAESNSVDALNASILSAPSLDFTISLAPFGNGVNSVAVRDGVVAVAVEADPKQDPGSVVFFDTDGNFISSVTVGALPDMLIFTPDGTKVVVANEGEPDDDYVVDPEGSISIIDISGGVAGLTQAQVATASFESFNGRINNLRRANIRIFGPNATVAQDIEPEYITISPDSSTAYVTLQENNALAFVDLATASVTSIKSFGYKNHRLPNNSLDASDKDGAINIRTWPVKGMYQPDAIASYEHDGMTYLVTANEGDSRDYDGFSEEARVKDLALGSGLLKSEPGIQANANLGRLKVTTAVPSGKKVLKGEEVYSQLFSYGARSFSIWNAEGGLVYDSGDDFERILADALPAHFNASNDSNGFDGRSDDKGPEPEGVVVGLIDGSVYAFIGLERVGGIMVYDVTNPMAPTFVEYVNNRDFNEDPEAGSPGDLGPEGLVFVPAASSPSGKALLIVANEVSGTTTIYEITSL